MADRPTRTPPMLNRGLEAARTVAREPAPDERYPARTWPPVTQKRSALALAARKSVKARRFAARVAPTAAGPSRRPRSVATVTGVQSSGGANAVIAAPSGRSRTGRSKRRSETVTLKPPPLEG